MRLSNKYTTIYIGIIIALMTFSWVLINWIPFIPFSLAALPMMIMALALIWNHIFWNRPQVEEPRSIGCAGLCCPIGILIFIAINVVTLSYPAEGFIWLLSPFHNPNYWIVVISIVGSYFLGTTLSNYILNKRHASLQENNFENEE